MTDASRAEKVRLFTRLAYELGVDISTLPGWETVRRVEAENKRTRNDRIRLAYSGGQTLRQIAAEFGLSVQRVHQIVDAPNKRLAE